MSQRHRIIFLFACAALVAGSAGCGNKKEVRAAKRSLYDAEFPVVFAAVLEATRELYPNIDDNPGTGAVKTAWHQVSYANTQDELANQRTIAQGQGLAPQSGTGSVPTRLAYKRFFVRFEVSVTGGRPWRVKVVGHASEWEPGNAVPTDLRGASKPSWLEGRTEALQLAIYKRIKAFAVPMREQVVADPDANLPKTDPKAFKNLPAPAAALLASLKDSVVLRDYGSLRARLAADVVWSLGGTPGADTAMAMWQADPESLDALVRLITAGCAGTATRVTCPGVPPAPGAWQLIIEPRGGEWKVTTFAKAE